MKNATSWRSSEMKPSEHDSEKRSSETAQEFESSASAKVSEITQGVGKRVEAVGKSMREAVSPEGVVGGAATAVANKVEETSAYLQETTLEDIVKNLTGFVRRHPLPALLVGFGVGYLLARNTR